jgi:uncharacterized protein YjbJ (UPF0337 family)
MRQILTKEVQKLMNWDQMQGKWTQMKGSIKEQWGKLTDDDLEQINGREEKFIGKVQERYGIAKEEAKRRVEEWLRSPAFDKEHVSTGPRSSHR